MYDPELRSFMNYTSPIASLDWHQTNAMLTQIVFGYTNVHRTGAGSWGGFRPGLEGKDAEILHPAFDFMFNPYHLEDLVAKIREQSSVFWMAWERSTGCWLCYWKTLTGEEFVGRTTSYERSIIASVIEAIQEGWWIDRPLKGQKLESSQLNQTSILDTNTDIIGTNGNGTSDSTIDP